MARKAQFGIATYIKQTAKKRKGQHRKKKGPKRPHKKKYVGQGRPR